MPRCSQSKRHNGAEGSCRKLSSRVGSLGSLRLLESLEAIGNLEKIGSLGAMGVIGIIIDSKPNTPQKKRVSKTIPCREKKTHRPYGYRFRYQAGIVSS